MINTNCEQCIFSDNADSESPCLFNIIDFIKNKKTITTKNNYFCIQDYQCRYCFSKNVKENNSEILKDLDLINEIKKRNLIQYSMVVDFRDNQNYEKAIEIINSLSIAPRYLLMLCYQETNKNIKNIGSKIQNITWKVQNFFQDKNEITYNEAIKTAIDTNLAIARTPFLLIENANNLEHIRDTQAIEKINYIVNIEQPICNFIRSSKNTETNFYNMFMNYNTYKHIVKNINPSLEEGINSLKDTTIIYYD